MALARAVYANRDIVILDDPLSALDVHVGNKVFEKLVVEHLKDKLVMLVTHNVSLLRHADCVIYIDDGRIVSMGKHADLVASSADFREFIDTKNDQAEKEQEKSNTDGSEGDVVSPNAVIPKVKKRASSNSQAGHTDAERQAGSKMIKAEVREHGGLKARTVLTYFGSFFPMLSAYPTILLIFFFMILAKGCDILTGWWLSWWYVCLQYFIANFFHITNKFIRPFIFQHRCTSVEVTEELEPCIFYWHLRSIDRRCVDFSTLFSAVYCNWCGCSSNKTSRPYATCFA